MKELMMEVKVSKQDKYRRRLKKDHRISKSEERKAEVRVEIESDFCKECWLWRAF